MFDDPAHVCLGDTINATQIDVTGHVRFHKLEYCTQSTKKLPFIYCNVNGQWTLS